MLESVDAIAFIGVDGAVREVDAFTNEVDMKLVVGANGSEKRASHVTILCYTSRYHFRAGLN